VVAVRVRPAVMKTGTRPVGAKPAVMNTSPSASTAIASYPGRRPSHATDRTQASEPCVQWWVWSRMPRRTGHAMVHAIRWAITPPPPAPAT